jgi:hypothetical protein
MAMKKQPSIIKKIRTKKPPNVDHIAMITGSRWVSKPAFYRNIKTGEDYFDIAGAVAWPGNEVAGFAVIVAVVKTDEKEPCLKVLTEIEEKSIEDLVSACIEIRGRYGYPELLSLWYGDYLRFSSLIGDINVQIEKQHGQGNGFYITQPDDFEASNNFEIYLHRIRACLKAHDSGKKQLILGNCNGLRNHLQNLPPDAITNGSVEDYPAVASLGFALHTLMAQRPWVKHAESETLVSTQKGDYETSAIREQIEAQRYFGVGDLSDTGEYDVDDLLNTIPD